MQEKGRPCSRPIFYLGSIKIRLCKTCKTTLTGFIQRSGILRPRVEKNGSYDQIEKYRFRAGLTQLEMAGLLGITRGAYARGVSRFDSPPVRAWDRFQALLTLPTPEAGEDFIIIAWDGHTAVPLDKIVKQITCACGKKVYSTAHNRKYCNTCRKRRHRGKPRKSEPKPI